jgi:hypothetical protein
MRFGIGQPVTRKEDARFLLPDDAPRAPGDRNRALSRATSVPDPMATPTVASVSAGASLMPSPSIATTRPCATSSLIRASLSSGNRSASTSPMPRLTAARTAPWLVAGGSAAEPAAAGRLAVSWPQPGRAAVGPPGTEFRDKLLKTGNLTRLLRLRPAAVVSALGGVLPARVPGRGGLACPARLLQSWSVPRSSRCSAPRRSNLAQPEPPSLVPRAASVGHNRQGPDHPTVMAARCPRIRRR